MIAGLVRFEGFDWLVGVSLGSHKIVLHIPGRARDHTGDHMHQHVST